MGVEETSEIGVEAFVARDQFVGECEAWHETALFEPEDGCEGGGEEDSFDGGVGYETLGEGCCAGLDPFACPVGLFADAGDCKIN